MKITENSRVIPFKVNAPTKEEIERLHIPEEFKHIVSYLTKIGDNIYHYKSIGVQSLTNELIGTYLSKRIGLDTVEYEIGKRETDGALFALSKIFYEEGYRYQSVPQFLEENHFKSCWQKLGTPFFQAMPLYYNMKTLRAYRGTPFYDSNLKLIAVDLKMGQYDRHSNNMQIKIDSLGTIDLAPIYDYGGAYMHFLTQSYINPFVYIKKNKETLEWIFTMYPELYGYVRLLQGLSIPDILDDIAQEKRVEFTDVEYSCYDSLQQANDDFVGKIKVKTIF